MQTLDDGLDDRTITRKIALMFLFSGFCKLFNLLIIFLFFYMAVVVDGSLMTGYKETLKRLEELHQIRHDLHSLQHTSS